MKYKFFLITVLTLFCVKTAAQSAGGCVTGIIVDEAGVFTYDPKTEEVKQVMSLSGNLNFIHFFD